MRALRGGRDSRPPGRDPAPTLIAYRMQRLWLTPMFRAVVRLGLPALAVAAFGSWFMSSPDRVDMLYEKVSDLRSSIEERPEFMVKLMELKGASDSVSDDIREILPIDFPVSSFSLDLEAMRRIVLGLDAVSEATLRIKPGGILEIALSERVPAVVWKTREMVELLDDTGHRVKPVNERSDYPDLPLVAGVGADRAVPEALQLLAAAAPLGEQIVGLLRVGERRWDIVLLDGKRILLPAKAPVVALERVIALDQVRDMLSRDLVLVDMRKPGRPTLRLTENAVKELREMKTIEAGGTEG
ncbi:cell division protein FtsQ/DivIB [Brevirhabdus sp.]|uniref:cell division protein FtsQ/DivIB n=1 Tax=Brevirhabdus sp. TaxID=2004514 RepID=UPI004059F3E9